MTRQEAEILIRKYTADECTAEEKHLVETYFLQYLKNADHIPDQTRIISDNREMLRFISEHTQTKQSNIKILKLWPRIAAAASIIIGMSIIGYFLINKQRDQQLAQNQPEQIAPVNRGVVLSLGNGHSIALNKKHQGQIAAVTGAQINQSDSLLQYNSTTTTDEQPVMNTLTNNGGHKFSVTLADGTEATLDIASSITYPAAFSGKERKVSISGQVYLKVKHIANQVFKVTTVNQVIKDIGTEFNVNAYPDEPIAKTTLIEGAIQISAPAGARAVTLKPGEQATIIAAEISVGQANIEEATAWLQGQIIFHHETLENIMKKVARIYNVTIVWEDQETKKLTFGGSVTRSEKLATILNYFRKAGEVDFKVEGRTVKIFKKKK